MPRWEFLTVADELLAAAEAVAGYYDGLGYVVVAEARDLGYPFAPTVRVKRHSTTCFVEVMGEFAEGRLREWVAYGRSVNVDTRVVLAAPDTVNITTRQNLALKNMGVGLLLISALGSVTEAYPAKDLAVNVELPDIASGSRRLRQALGPVYEHFDRNHWREGFEEACVALETAARTHLKKAIQSGRTVVLTDAGNVKNLTPQRIDKMTMGQLGRDYQNLQKQTHSDSVIASALQRINKDRIGVAHKKRQSATEKALRENVGSHMWTIVAALREIYV